jgi:outer membrane protein TolC
MLTVRQRVATAYWSLWQLRRERRWHRQHLGLLDSLLTAVRTRVEIGKSSLADLNQLELRVARIEDIQGSLERRETAARARLLEAVGAPMVADTPVGRDAPEVRAPARSERELVEQAERHPRIAALVRTQKQRDLEADRAALQRYPDLVLGVDYIETGRRDDVDLPDNGKDPVMAMIGIRLPVWGADYTSAEEAGRARARAVEARIDAARLEAAAGVRATLAELEDLRRRITLFRKTLLPQAEAVYRSTTGSYEAGSSTIAAVLLAQQDLLDLRVELSELYADHARTVARLEQIVAAPLPAAARASSAPAPRGEASGEAGDSTDEDSDDEDSATEDSADGDPSDAGGAR